MSGRCTRASFGQLALIDAVIFFVISTAVSSLMLYYADAEAVDQAPAMPEGQFDPNAVLRVFLHASLGADVTLGLDGGTHILASSDVAECIHIELEALALGADAGQFELLNQRLLLMLRGTCSVLLTPYLIATWLSEDCHKTLLAIPIEPPQSRTRYAGSVEMSGLDESSFLLTLILVPASLSEVVHIGASDLDFGSGVGQAPANFQP